MTPEINFHTDMLAILHKKVTGATLQTEELEKLQQWLAASEHNNDLYQRLLQERTLTGLLIARQALDHTKAWTVLSEKIAAEQAPVRTLHPAMLRKWSAVAAAMILFFGLGIYFWYTAVNNNTNQVTSTSPIAPGKEGAILTLADGSQVVLDSNGNSLIPEQNGVHLSVQNGTLVYAVASPSRQDPQLNTMTTPKGQQFSLVLPDGTKVWLNAASSLIYPTVFTGNQRKVTLSGEGYFEVAKNPQMPFSVQLQGGKQVDILGTNFNIQAYEEDSAIYTTLLEGSLSVEGKLIQPGQQAIIQNSQFPQSDVTIINNADVEKVMAWRRGLFNFEGASLKEVMKLLERWYDIEIVYEKGAPTQTSFFGKISKLNTLQEVLTILEKSEVRFRQEGNRKLVVLKENL